MKVLQNYILQEDGATAIEYGMIVAAIGAGVAVIVFLLGDELLATFESLLTVFAG